MVVVGGVKENNDGPFIEYLHTTCHMYLWPTNKAEWQGLKIVPQIDPLVPQPAFTITEKAPTRAFSWLKAR